ncbi:MAG: YicC/YloC family endoribonuclease [Desulfuromonadaceae bacterium]|nr:YicC family protein [Desulfuromonas sp.]MDY0185197.1 YicC/YloC family endoribonuclease [Desulfuromonadaceae bacterium]
MNSMTGYGKGSNVTDAVHYIAEIKTVNHRYIDVSVKLPRSLMFLETEVKNWVSAYLHRGKIDVYISREGDSAELMKPQLNETAAAAYVDIYKQLIKRFNLAEDIPLSMLAAQKEVVVLSEPQIDETNVRERLKEAVTEALAAVVQMRGAEGRSMNNDIVARLQVLEEYLGSIEHRTPQVVAEWQQKLQRRIEALVHEVEVDPQRLAQEVAVFADRCDISEEVVRFKSHIEQMHGLLANPGAVGRQMDFLLQELNREANTMGSKSNDAELTRNVVALKAELEKIREQVQNIE